MTTYVFGQKKQRVSVVLYQQFTGDGSDVTFQLTDPAANATWLATHGAWAAGNIHTTYPAHITKTNKKPIYDSIIPLTRHRITVSSISAAGLVTLDYAPRNTVDFYVWYWYQLSTDDILSAYYRADFIASMEGEMIGTVSLYDTDSSNVLTLGWNEDSSNDRTLNLAGLVGGDRTLILNENFTIADGYDVTLQALGQANSVILNESLTVGGGYDGTITFSAASKVLTVDESASISDFVRETDFNADTFLYATDNNTPVATSPANVMAALSGHAAAAFDFNSQNLTGVGTIAATELTLDNGTAPITGQFLAQANAAGGLAILVYSADNVTIGFDVHRIAAHYKSLDAGSNFDISKSSDTLTIRYDSGVEVGADVTMNDGIRLDTSGNFDIIVHDAATVGLKLGGTLVEVSAAELNYSEGVTSAIQDQLDARCLESVFGTAISTGLALDGTDLKASTVLQVYHGINPSADVQSLLGCANEAAIRTLLDLEAGTDFYSVSTLDTALALLAPIDAPAFTTSLDLAVDTDVSAQIGRAHIGDVISVADYAGFSHIDKNAIGSYALLQFSDGTTYVNAPTGKTVSLRINNADALQVDANRNIDITQHDAATIGLKLGGTLVTASAAELNQLDDNTLINHLTLHITDTDGDTEGDIWYDASEDKLKFKTAAGVETITSV